jgi:hypothetical protein
MRGARAEIVRVVVVLVVEMRLVFVFPRQRITANQSPINHSQRNPGFGFSRAGKIRRNWGLCKRQ